MTVAMLAIDPSLNSTGYAFRDSDDQSTVTVVGSIRPKKITGMARLHFVEQKIEELVEAVKPRTVVYEDYSMGSKGKTFHIGELGGVLKLFLWERGIDIILVPPSNLKLFVTGKGNADKDVMMRVLAQHRGRLFNNSDEADAYGLLLAGEAFCNRKLLPRVRGNSKQIAVQGFTVIEGKKQNGGSK